MHARPDGSYHMRPFWIIKDYIGLGLLTLFHIYVYIYIYLVSAGYSLLFEGAIIER